MSAAPPVDPALLESLRGTLALEGRVRVAVLFGSQARGAARPDSDVDVAVLGRGVDRLALAAALSAALERVVDVVAIDDSADPSIPLLEELVRDGIVVFEARPGAGAAWRSRVLAQLETDRPWYARMRDAWLARVAEKGV